MKPTAYDSFSPGDESICAHLILSPIIRKRRGIMHFDWHISNALTWARKCCNLTTKQWHYCATKVDDIIDDPARQAVVNCVGLLGVNDVYWLEDAFSFVARHARVDGLRGKLARQILNPFAYLHADERYDDDELLNWSAFGKQKAIARTAKRGSCSYGRYGNRIYLFADKHTAKRTAGVFEWTDLRNGGAEFMGYRIRYLEGKAANLKTKKGGLEIRLADTTIENTLAEARNIAESSDQSTDYKLRQINNLSANFVARHKYAAAGVQFDQLGKQIRAIVRQKVATRGKKRETVKQLFFIGKDSIDARLWFVRGNPFWEPKTPDEPLFREWWTPYREDYYG